MLEKLKQYFNRLFDLLAPRRKNAVIADRINAETIHNLAKAPEVEGLSWIHSLFHYKDNHVRAIIWELKYKENLKPLEFVGQILYEEIIELLSDIVLFDQSAKFLLVPIPISVEKRIERGYNQSERILLYAPQWLEKTKDTTPQSHTVSRTERLTNLSGCFSADERVSGYYVILIDDVTTTGATLAEARSTLLSAGARDVFAFTIAH